MNPKDAVKTGTTGIAPMARAALRRLRAAVARALGRDAAAPFPGSAEYWRQRYASGADSGPGSYGKFAHFKADVLNDFFATERIRSAIEFGSGDGNQLALLKVPEYLGIDVSAEAIALCRTRFAGRPGRRFALADDYRGERADCALSLDVIYHLVEDPSFEAYMRDLFGAAERFVVIYASNRLADASDGTHVRHRRFTDWIDTHRPDWTLVRHIPNAYPYRGDYRTGSFADFYVFAAPPAPA
jgi:hypothetical protein